VLKQRNDRLGSDKLAAARRHSAKPGDFGCAPSQRLPSHGLQGSEHAHRQLNSSRLSTRRRFSKRAIRKIFRRADTFVIFSLLKSGTWLTFISHARPAPRRHAQKANASAESAINYRIARRKPRLTATSGPTTAVSAALQRKKYARSDILVTRLCSKSMGSARRNPGSAGPCPKERGFGQGTALRIGSPPIPHRNRTTTPKLGPNLRRCIVASPLHNFSVMTIDIQL
jgi:hypothetical protein